MGQRQGWEEEDELGWSQRGQLLDTWRSRFPQDIEDIDFPNLPVPLADERGFVGLPGAPSQRPLSNVQCGALLSPGLPLATSPGTTTGGSWPLSQMDTSSRTYFSKHISGFVVLCLETSKTKPANISRATQSQPLTCTRAREHTHSHCLPPCPLLPYGTRACALR